MADQFDRASELEQKATEIARLYRKPEGPQPIGSCYNCGEALEGDQRFCDADCRDDWERSTGKALGL